MPKRKKGADSKTSAKKKQKATAISAVEPVDHAKQQSQEDHTPSEVLVMGQGDVGQLGLGEDIMERKRPCKVGGALEGVCVVQVECGGMHTVALSSDGKVFTWGCNDEGALGRDGDEYTPLPVVKLKDHVIRQVSAGDSHTAALTSSGCVYFWGVFRNSSGPIGTPAHTPTLVALSDIKKVASGADHVVLLTNNGNVFTFGCAEQGQMGRVAQRYSYDGGRRGLSYLLNPAAVTFQHAAVKKKKFFENVFCGSYHSFAVTDSEVFGWGLNNFHQLDSTDTLVYYHPQCLDHVTVPDTSSVMFCGGEHHTLMSCSGDIHVVGRKEYGRLGLGKDEEPKSFVRLNTEELRVKSVAAGGSVSFAVTEDGLAYAWGMGSNLQLGSGNEDDQWEPNKVTGKQLEGRKVIDASVGGQHSALLVTSETASK